MVATYTMITEEQMTSFLEKRGFKPVPSENLPSNTRELVYGKIVGKDLCLRIFTSITNEVSRDVGKDAIRCVLMYRFTNKEGKTIIRPVGKDRRVHRVEGWKKNLESRINNWEQSLGPSCKKCQAPTVERQGKYGGFYGCVRFPDCDGIIRGKF